MIGKRRSSCKVPENMRRDKLALASLSDALIHLTDSDGGVVG
jgi:hypothetical protein